MRLKTARRPILPLETEWLKRLKHCTFGTSAPEKYFARDMQGATEITARQSEMLQRMVWRYRRQLGLDDANAKGAQGKA